MSVCLSPGVERTHVAEYVLLFSPPSFSPVDSLPFSFLPLCPVPLLALPSTAVGPAEDKAFEVESVPQLLAALGVSLCF